MKCPVCTDTALMMAERHNIEIDYCPKCRGVWLDRGELDKIISQATTLDMPARAANEPPPPSAHPANTYPPPGAQGYPPPQYDPRYDPRHDYRKKKKWWDDMFDFD